MARGSLIEAFTAIERQTAYRFLYSVEDVQAFRVEAGQFRDASIDEVLRTVLDGTGLTWQIGDGVISIKKALQPAAQTGTAITGKVSDTKGAALGGVVISVKNSNIKVSSEADGRFRVVAPAGTQPVLQFDYVGMKSKEVTYRREMQLLVTMEETTSQIESVVVTGLFSRRQDSYSGSAATYSGSELKMIGNQNVLKSLKALDPSFNIIENNQWGADPNRLPNIEINGKSSVIGLINQYGTDPNQPLFILDGFESSLQTISDLSMDRIESITILKDATATAIYGSKSANGVIVVETKKPKAGRLQINYNGNFQFAWADLSQYNLMNSFEKLEFERLSRYFGNLDSNGNFTSENDEQEWYNLMKEAARGVNTYWMNEPLRFAPSSNNTLSIEGGDEFMRYQAGLTYGKTQGVMKGSDREVINGNIRLMYRTGKVSFVNNLNLDNVTTNNPAISFSRFSRENPYFRKYDDDGNILKILPKRHSNNNYVSPLYDMTRRNIDESGSFGFTNNFEFLWDIVDGLRGRVRLGIGKTVDDHSVFLSPYLSRFASSADENKGSYTGSNGKAFDYNGEASVTYGKLVWEKHLFNISTGFTFTERNTRSDSYTATGFTDDTFTNPSYAWQYAANTVPSYSETKGRTASYYAILGYAFDGRYLLDASYRNDGSSVFGMSRHFTDTWSVGVAWNAHNEAFIRDLGIFNTLKIRLSAGNPGNQNFSGYISTRVYSYNHKTGRNPFGTSMVISSYGNPNLAWQKTVNKNAGLDLVILGNRLRVNFDYYYKTTDPLLVYMSVPSSTGATTIPYNMGELITKGITISLNYSIIKREEMIWSVGGNMRNQKERYENISDALSKFNLENQGANLIRYYDGASPNDLWAVRSAGIDPGTGYEMFLTREGAETFEYDYVNEVKVGNTEPKFQGNVGTSFWYKGFSINLNMDYRVGGQIFMTALFNKVENIADRGQNQDKRALYDRWQKPGDQAKFKAIGSLSSTPISSRFVMDNNILQGTSIRLGYETQARWVRAIGASSLNFSAYMNDIFYLSTVKNERGIDFPFQRSVSFSIGARF